MHANRVSASLVACYCRAGYHQYNSADIANQTQCRILGETIPDRPADAGRGCLACKYSACQSIIGPTRPRGSSRRGRWGDGRRFNASGSMQQNVHSESLSATQMHCAHQTMNVIRSQNASLRKEVASMHECGIAASGAHELVQSRHPM